MSYDYLGLNRRIWIGHLVSGTSNKVFISTTVKDGETYTVICLWGGYGKKLSSQTKFSNQSDVEAFCRANHIFQKKETKGYVDIESAGYTGELTLKNTWLEAELKRNGLKFG